MHAFDFVLVLFSFVFVCRDLVASRRRQHIVFGRRRLKLIVRRDERDREARRVGGRGKEEGSRNGCAATAGLSIKKSSLASGW
jgi:hypothetical protein